ncbi:hypothetical protein KA005_63765 [bacterium]|nr:hypothetical protein [bacterium]
MSKIVGFFLCIIIIFIGIVSADEDGSTQRVQNLNDEGNKAYSNKDYGKAIEAYLKATTYPEAEDIKLRIFYNISCSYSLLGDAEKALEYLDSTVEAGYVNYRWLNKDTDFDFLRKNYEQEFKEVYNRIKAAKTNEIMKNKLISIVVYDNYDGPHYVSDYDWKDINRPEMDTLRTRYELHQVVENEITEFEKMKRLLNWVATRWQHDGSKMAPKRTALAILSEVEQGKRFCCANYADVLKGCMRSLGYPTRFVGLRTEDAAYNMGGGHGCIEVWSNQYQKWILLDAQNNAWWDHNDIPLNAYECHQLFVNGKEDELIFVGQHEHFDYSQIKTSWCIYFHSVTNYWLGEALELVSGEVIPELLYQNNPQNNVITSQYDRVYPQMNRTTITLRHNSKGSLDSLTVILNHTMPHFDRYLVRIDERDWQEVEDTLRWVLNQGVNTIEAVAVNVADIEGRPSRIAVRYNLTKAD